MCIRDRCFTSYFADWIQALYELPRHSIKCLILYFPATLALCTITHLYFSLFTVFAKINVHLSPVFHVEYSVCVCVCILDNDAGDDS